MKIYMIRRTHEKAHDSPSLPKSEGRTVLHPPVTETENSESITLQPGSGPGPRRMPVARVRLSRGFTAVVDPNDAPLVQKRVWQHRDRAGKRMAYTLDCSGSRPREVLMHHLVVDVPPGRVVIHLNHNGLDNRRANLQVVERGQARAHARTRGAIPGMWHDPSTNTWHAEVLTREGLASLGPFQTPEETTAAIESVKQPPAHLVEPVSRLNAEPAEVVAEDEPEAEEPLLSTSPIRASRSATGVNGVTWDAVNQRYMVRVNKQVRRFKTLEEAAREASIAQTTLGQFAPVARQGERLLTLGRHRVRLDRGVAEWLPQLGPWRVHRRRTYLLDVRRARRGDDDPDANYLTAAELIAAPGPNERVQFVNGDRLDLRVANLRLVPRQTNVLAPGATMEEHSNDEAADSEDFKLLAKQFRAACHATR